jgi:UDP:flavonoid glycosyltransferase YjiC (YdhE family)
MEGFAQRSFKMNPLQWLRALLDEAFFPNEQVIFDAAQTLVTENDFVIGHHFLYPLKLAALLQSNPFYSVKFCHAGIANPLLPPFRFPNFGVYLNSISWKLLDLIFNWTLKRPLTRLWLQSGQIPPTNILSELLTSQQLNLVAVDPLFCQGNEQWSSNHQACGFLNLSEDERYWELPDDLLKFLDAGSAPIYMTFGSLQKAVPEWSMDLFLEAVEQSGCRAIIQTSSSRFMAGTQQPHVYFIGKHPHQQVFKCCAGVVHHGGAGTSHAATRSGCPSIVIPFMDEQLFWAKQLQILGLAGKSLPAKYVSANTLAQAIQNVLNNSHYYSTAQNASTTMQKQDGVGKAVALLTQQLTTVRS